MQNFIVYRANTTDEIYECSYSLLKYLTVYNVKPPLDQTVVIYTSQPAMLEIYGPFFNQFELKDVQPSNPSSLALLKHFFKDHVGNALYLDTNTYPIAPLEPLFSDLAKGHSYVLKWNSITGKKNGSDKTLQRIELGESSFETDISELKKWNDSVLGFNSQYKELINEILEQTSKARSQLKPELVEKWLLHSNLQGLNVRTAGHVIAQYDDLKEFGNLLRKFFTKYQEESVPNQLKLIQHFDAAMIQQQKKAFQSLPFHQKLLKRLTGQHWSIEKYKV
jgi:hypothetical protein